MRNLQSWLLASFLIVALVGLFGGVSPVAASPGAGTISTSEYLDIDNNGTVEIIRWTMSETATSCTYEADDWSVDTAGSISTTITGVSCTGTDTFIDIAVSADTNETGGVVDPIISYSDVGTAGSLSTASGFLSTKLSVTADDGADPVALSTSPVDSDPSVGISEDVVITFSEAMTTTFDTDGEGPQFSIAPNPGGWSDVWSAGDTVVTLSHTLFANKTTYTFTINAGDVSDANFDTLNSGIGIPVPLEFDFTVGQRRRSATAPKNLGLVINNDDPTTPSQDVQLTLNADGATEMLLSNNDVFTGAEWEDFEPNKAWTLTEGVGEKKVYALFRNIDKNLSMQIFDAIELVGPTEPAAVPEPEEDPVDPIQPTNPDVPTSITPAVGGDFTPIDYMAGRWIKTADRHAVYLVDSVGNKHLYPVENVYESYFGLDFSRVETVSVDILQSYPLTTDVPYKAGTLMTTPTTRAVYEVETPAILHHLMSEEVAETRWGSSWRSSVYDLPDVFFGRYTIGTPIS